MKINKEHSSRRCNFRLHPRWLLPCVIVIAGNLAVNFAHAAPEPLVRPAFTAPESSTPSTPPAPARNPGMSAIPPDNFDPAAFGEISSATLPLENGQRIVMRVNGEPITWDVMMTQVRLSGASLYERFPQAEASIAAALSAPVRDSLILNALYQQFAREHSLALQPQEISQRTRSIISQGDPILKAGLKRLTPDQITQMVTDKLTREKVTRYLGDSATSAPPTLAELTSFTATMRPTTSPMEVLRARHIVIRATPDMSEFNRNDARARAEEIWRKLKPETRSDDSATSADNRTTSAGISASIFAAAARSFSQDRFTAYLGGDLGYFRAGTMYPEVNKALESLSPGQITPVIKTPVGYHIFQLTERHQDNLRLLYHAWRKQTAVQNWQTQAGREARVEDYLE